MTEVQHDRVRVRLRVRVRVRVRVPWAGDLIDGGAARQG